MTTWGVVSTIKAPRQDVLNFAAYHLDLGAHRLYLYLDAPDAALANELSAHPRIKVVQTDAKWWEKRGGRPAKHQPRQIRNARHAYNRRVECDWLCHIDVDEFVVPDQPMSDILATLPPGCLCARVRPMEAMAATGDAPRHFKRRVPATDEAMRIAADLYPTFGAYFPGGFLSHRAGKLFYRTGVEGFFVKIHRAFVGEDEIRDAVELTTVELAHLHAHNWDHWRAHFEYRHEIGSYRPELRTSGPLSMHDVMAMVRDEDGEDGLRMLYDELMQPTPDTLRRLKAYGLYREVHLDLDLRREKHFPTG